MKSENFTSNPLIRNKKKGNVSLKSFSKRAYCETVTFFKAQLFLLK